MELKFYGKGVVALSPLRSLSALHSTTLLTVDMSVALNLIPVLNFKVILCFDLAWINARCPPKLLLHSPSSAGQGRGNMMKGSRAETRTGRDH